MKNATDQSKTQKFMDDYNYHDWAQFMVRKVSEKPQGPHFAAVLLEKETRYETDPYKGDHNNFQVDVVHYFAFPARETLEAWVLRASHAKKEFFFFEVKKLGEVSLRVEVDLGV